MLLIGSICLQRPAEIETYNGGETSDEMKFAIAMLSVVTASTPAVHRCLDAHTYSVCAVISVSKVSRVQERDVSARITSWDNNVCIIIHWGIRSVYIYTANIERSPVFFPFPYSSVVFSSSVYYER